MPDEDVRDLWRGTGEFLKGRLHWYLTDFAMKLLIFVQCCLNNGKIVALFEFLRALQSLLEYYECQGTQYNIMIFRSRGPGFDSSCGLIFDSRVFLYFGRIKSSHRNPSGSK